MGIAFSLGFILGPMIGAVFAVWAKSKTGDWFVVPARFAMFLAFADLLFFIFFFKESLPKVCIVQSLIVFHLMKAFILGKTQQKHKGSFKQC